MNTNTLDRVSRCQSGISGSTSFASYATIPASRDNTSRPGAYLKERKQFDRIIGEFQVLQHRAAELFCGLELTRAKDAPLSVSQAKARAGLTADRAVQEGGQMHGGIGVTDELDLGFFMKRARVLQELFGDAKVQMDRVAGMGGY